VARRRRTEPRPTRRRRSTVAAAQAVRGRRCRPGPTDRAAVRAATPRAGARRRGRARRPVVVGHVVAPHRAWPFQQREIGEPSDPRVGVSGTEGSGGPVPSPAAAAARSAGQPPSNTNPKPSRIVSRSSSVTAHWVGTVSTRWPSSRRSTRDRPAWGQAAPPGRSRTSSPASASDSANAAAMGLVFELIRTELSTPRDPTPAGSVVPAMSNDTSPSRQTPTTAPGPHRDRRTGASLPPPRGQSRSDPGSRAERAADRAAHQTPAQYRSTHRSRRNIHDQRVDHGPFALIDDARTGQPGPCGVHSMWGHWSITTSAPTARARSPAASSTTPSCNQMPGTPTSSA